MIHGLPFLFLDLLRSSLRRPTFWVLFSLSVFLALSAMSALVLLQGGGSGGGPEEVWYVSAGLSEDLSEREINRIAREIWGMEGVEGVSFRFRGDEAPWGPVEVRTLLVRAADRTRASALAQEIGGIEGIVGAEVHRFLASPPASLPPLSRMVALVCLVLSLVGAMLAGVLALGDSLKGWRREWRLLRLSGLPPEKVLSPFLLLGSLFGLTGGLLYLVLFLGLRGWAGSIEAVRDLAPNYLNPGAFPFLLTFIVGPLLGGLAGIVGLILVSGRGEEAT